jgi:hypothetical protein
VADARHRSIANTPFLMTPVAAARRTGNIIFGRISQYINFLENLFHYVDRFTIIVKGYKIIFFLNIVKMMRMVGMVLVWLGWLVWLVWLVWAAWGSEYSKRSVLLKVPKMRIFIYICIT